MFPTEIRSLAVAPDGSTILFSTSSFDTYVTSAAPYTSATLLHDDAGTMGVGSIRYASDSNTAVVVGAGGAPARALLVNPKTPGWIQELGSVTAGAGVRCVAFQGELCRI